MLVPVHRCVNVYFLRVTEMPNAAGPKYNFFFSSPVTIFRFHIPLLQTTAVPCTATTFMTFLIATCI